MKKTTKPVCIRLPTDWIERLHSISRTKAFKEKRNINWHDLVREALEKTFGMTNHEKQEQE